MREGFDSGTQSPRPETPEPGSQQGRRNIQEGIQLLDDDGNISDQLETCLKHIFGKYCIPRPPPPPAAAATALLASRSIAGKSGRDSRHMELLVPPEGARLSPEGLDAWSKDTNGVPFSDETKQELIEFLDVTAGGELTFKGFLQLYQLQTENDEEETWRDLSSHGFDRSLRLVSSRREDETEC